MPRYFRYPFVSTNFSVVCGFNFAILRGLNCNYGQDCNRHSIIVIIVYGLSYPAKNA